MSTIKLYKISLKKTVPNVFILDHLLRFRHSNKLTTKDKKENLKTKEASGVLSSPGPGMLLLTEVFISDRGDEEGRVSGPFLNTGQVEERETAGAAPHLGREREVSFDCPQTAAC